MVHTVREILLSPLHAAQVTMEVALVLPKKINVQYVTEVNTVTHLGFQDHEVCVTLGICVTTDPKLLPRLMGFKESFVQWEDTAQRALLWPNHVQ